MSNIPLRVRELFLKKGEDFERVKREGRRSQSPLFNLVFSSTQHFGSRFGVVVGRRFGNAVKRNRAKRIVRELVRKVPKRWDQGYDCIVFPRRAMFGVPSSRREEEWFKILARERLIDCSTGID